MLLGRDLILRSSVYCLASLSPLYSPSSLGTLSSHLVASRPWPWQTSPVVINTEFSLLPGSRKIHLQLWESRKVHAATPCSEAVSEIVDDIVKCLLYHSTVYVPISPSEFSFVSRFSLSFVLYKHYGIKYQGFI